MCLKTRPLKDALISIYGLKDTPTIQSADWKILLNMETLEKVLLLEFFPPLEGDILLLSFFTNYISTQISFF